MLSVAAHVDVTCSAPESILDHAVDHLLIAELGAVPHTIDIVRSIRHRLLTAGDDHLLVTRLDRLAGEHHGLEPRAANLVNGECADARGNSCLEQCLASWCLA